MSHSTWIRYLARGPSCDAAESSHCIVQHDPRSRRFSRSAKGKISKQEWMKFMEAEFDRLDKDKSGELTPQELELSKVRVGSKSFAAVGK